MARYLLGAIVRLYGRLFKSGIEEMPAQHQVDRDRDAYEAEIAKVDHDHLSAKDEREVAELRAFVEEIGTDEFPTLAFAADPLGERIPDGYVMESETFFNDLAAAKLSAFTWTAAARTTVALSSVQVVEPGPPEPFALEGPTGVFPSDWITQVMAGGGR